MLIIFLCFRLQVGLWDGQALVGTDIKFKYRSQNKIVGRTGMDYDYGWLIAESWDGHEI